MALAAVPAAARPWPCLPPVFDGGQRLHALPAPQVFWLEPLLRQHELCWRRAAPPGELRVVLTGSSAVYGYPLPVEETFAGVLNQHFVERDIPARLFNLAFVNPYQVRDALIINEALAYEPDVIVYPLTLAEFKHLAPMPFPTLMRFFDMNARALRTLIAAPPPGLEQPFANYGQRLAAQPSRDAGVTNGLREAGVFLRLGMRRVAESIAARLNSPRPRFKARTKGRQSQYDCSDTEWKITSEFRDWKEWNILLYLEGLQRTRGIRVLLVHWPIAHEPIDACYSIRYTNAAVSDFVQWMASETRARGLAYIDLHDALPPELFLDSLHISPEGHRRIADAIAPVLDSMIQELWERRRPERASSAE